MEQSALSSDQLMPAGSGSLSVTPWAVPGPALLTVIVNAAVVTRVDRARVGGLEDGDVGALDGDGRVVGVRAVIGGHDRAGVVDGTAGRGVV